MGLFTNKKKEEKKAAPAAAKKTVKKSDKPAAKKADAKPVKKAATAKKSAADTGNAYRILVRPIVTEKSMMLGEMGQYVFEVSPGSNKVEIKKAINAVYGVVPTNVAIMRYLGKPVRTRHGRGRRKHWRKAIVTLKKGEKIELFTTKA